MLEVYSAEVENWMQQAGFTKEDIEMLEDLENMNEGWDDIKNEGWGLIEGYGLGIEADGYAVALNPIRL